MATYVLVHGAWGGAHGFRLVRPLLRAEGHAVFTPSLTGIGERVHLASPQVTLTTHIDDVVNTILFEDLDEIVLLGYSYGGMVITGALDHIADRISHLVYLDAFVPNDGQRVTDLTPFTAPERTPNLQWAIPPLPREYDDRAKTEWADARRVPHPVRCFTEAVHLALPLEEFGFSRTFVKATGEPRDDDADPFWRFADRLRSDPAWHYREIATSHMIPENRPVELSALLSDVAAS